MQYCTRNPALKKPEYSDARDIADINDNMDVIDGIISKNNYNAAIDPTVNDDVEDGYAVNSVWWNTTDHTLFIAEGVSTGAAVWRRIGLGNTSLGVDLDLIHGGDRNLATELRVGAGSLHSVLFSSGHCGMLISSNADGIGQQINDSYASWYCDLGGRNQFEFGTDELCFSRRAAGSATVKKLMTLSSIGDLSVCGNIGLLGSEYPAYSLTSSIAGAKHWGAISSAGELLIRNFTDEVNLIHIYNSGGMSLGSSVSDPGANNLYVTGDVNCASVTDHTPGYSGDALADLKGIANDAKGGIDHKTLPAFARARFKDPETGKETEGRNIGNMVSVLTKAVQQLTEKLEEAERKIVELQTKRG